MIISCVFSHFHPRVHCQTIYPGKKRKEKLIAVNNQTKSTLHDTVYEGGGKKLTPSPWTASWSKAEGRLAKSNPKSKQEQPEFRLSFIGTGKFRKRELNDYGGVQGLWIWAWKQRQRRCIEEKTTSVWYLRINTIAQKLMLLWCWASPVKLGKRRIQTSEGSPRWLWAEMKMEMKIYNIK